MGLQPKGSSSCRDSQQKSWSQGCGSSMGVAACWLSRPFMSHRELVCSRKAVRFTSLTLWLQAVITVRASMSVCGLICMSVWEGQMKCMNERQETKQQLWSVCVCLPTNTKSRGFVLNLVYCCVGHQTPHSYYFFCDSHLRLRCCVCFQPPPVYLVVIRCIACVTPSFVSC